ncbi:MAG: FAD:protein FMN transferase [Firmicutes bacterium]|nr:FAD:protein FMN transferase [candidate division NPL-UPA2 bacterium]
MADEAALADAMATAAMVLGVEQGIALIESFPGVEGLLVTDDGSVVMSQGMSAFTELSGR